MEENEGKTNIALFFCLCECVCVYSRISVVDILKLLSIFVKKRSYQFDLSILFSKITIREWAFFGSFFLSMFSQKFFQQRILLLLETYL